MPLRSAQNAPTFARGEQFLSDVASSGARAFAATYR
jgi:hypothetical protein